MRILPPILLLVHGALLAWALAGLAEWFLGDMPWPKVSNPLFPAWLQFVHWLAVLGGSVTFLAGYITKWSKTPTAMIAAYLAMAAVCVIETFWFLISDYRFIAMAAELSTYVAIVAMLYNLPLFRTRFAAA